MIVLKQFRAKFVSIWQRNFFHLEIKIKNITFDKYIEQVSDLWYELYEYDILLLANETDSEWMHLYFTNYTNVNKKNTHFQIEFVSPQSCQCM